MKVLVDTGVLLCGCLLLALIVGQAGTATVIWLIVAVTIAGLSMSTDQRQWGIAAPAAYLLVGALSTDSVTGAPLVVYVLVRLGALTTRRARMTAVAACIPFVAAVASRVRDTPVLALALVFCALAALLALRTVQEEAARRSLHVVRDDLREKVLTLQDTNAQLLQAQDYELRAAALAERTRIAREIHDGVGHLLTRLLLQVKALQVVHREEPGVVADLTTLDGGLDEALDSMRRSVHALSDDGEELATSLN
uniref:histidine kinase n=1 Tax=Actinomyces oris TaxID=544580 RepID=UPI0028EA0B71